MRVAFLNKSVEKLIQKLLKELLATFLKEYLGSFREKLCMGSFKKSREEFLKEYRRKS